LLAWGCRAMVRRNSVPVASEIEKVPGMKGPFTVTWHDALHQTT
jgi:hypothetical protein